MVKTHRGKDLDMKALKLANSRTLAIGNVKMNAKGDLLGKGGKVIKTREELAVEYATNVGGAAKNVPLSEEINKMLQPTKASQAPKLQPSKEKVKGKAATTPTEEKK
jgi:hypothetical protein